MNDIGSGSGKTPRYFLNLYSAETWRLMEANGATVTGFSEKRLGWAKRIVPGDFLLCYMTGEKRFFAVQRVESECFVDKTDFGWGEGAFPVRFKISRVIRREPSDGVDIRELLPRLSAYTRLASKNRWSVLVRGSLMKYSAADAEVILSALRADTPPTDDDDVVVPSAALVSAAGQSVRPISQVPTEPSGPRVAQVDAAALGRAAVLEKLRRLRELNDENALSPEAYRKFEDKILTRYLEL